jgi:hypothetical protein
VNKDEETSYRLNLPFFILDEIQIQGGESSIDLAMSE